LLKPLPLRWNCSLSIPRWAAAGASRAPAIGGPRYSVSGSLPRARPRCRNPLHLSWLPQVAEDALTAFGRSAPSLFESADPPGLRSAVFPEDDGQREASSAELRFKVRGSSPRHNENPRTSKSGPRYLAPRILFGYN
jgi:hypothetical protein